MRTTQQKSLSSNYDGGLCVLAVEPGSLAEWLGIEPNDCLVAINGRPVRDVLDYWYFGASGRVTVEWLSHRTNELHRRTIRKSPQERLGLELEPFEIKRCNNACVFCFVHQLPRGLRPELYIKDEDYRLSFLYGNYITGTSLCEDDINRILELRLSPLFFSVHATDLEIRRQLLANPNAPAIIPLLRRLTENGIAVHTQIVLCPGYNDEKVLEKTVFDLAELYPGLRSIAVVPVGLTAHRHRLPRLSAVTAEYARSFLPVCKQLQEKMIAKLGFPLLFPSDEFYLIAGELPPSYEDYDEIPQLENGVGMLAQFYRSLPEVLEALPSRLSKPMKVVAITSTLGYKVIERLLRELTSRVANLHIHADVRENSLFGSGITVTGLLPGRDFLAAITDNPDANLYLIPENALRPWDMRFLDDIQLTELQEASQHRVRVGGSSAWGFVEPIIATASE